jgi:hypothetical protein
MNGKDMDGRALTVNVAKPARRAPPAAAAVVVNSAAAAAVVLALMPKFCKRCRKPVTPSRRRSRPPPSRRSSPGTTSSASRRPARARRRRSRCPCSPGSRRNRPGQRRGTRVLVIAPTRELVLQIEENIRAYAKHLPLTVATVFGGVGEQPQIRALRAGTDVIIACPGRLLDLMGRRCADFSGLAISRARRSRPDAGHGFSAGHPADRPQLAASNGRR